MRKEEKETVGQTSQQDNQIVERKEHFHGSDLEKIEQIYHIKKEDITSFSANVNPLGVSYKLRETLANHIDAITSYPDREYSSLRESIASYINADKEHIMVGNGSTELISIFISMVAPKKALLLAPTYSEYEREITLAGGTYSYYTLQKENNFQLPVKEFLDNLDKDLDLLILCNPNNPTSTTLMAGEIRTILASCKKKGIYVIIDETYVEFVENVDEITAIPLVKEFDNVTILRGISKFFAAPGLRLGYAVCSNESLLATIREKKNPWTINSLASIAGEIMFSDTDYIQKTKELIAAERKRVCDRLHAIEGLRVYPSYANFVLVEITHPWQTAFGLFEKAIRQGLMIRDCVTFPGLSEYFFRVCYMMPEKNEELLQVIEDYMK